MLTGTGSTVFSVGLAEGSSSGVERVVGFTVVISVSVKTYFIKSWNNISINNIKYNESVLFYYVHFCLIGFYDVLPSLVQQDVFIWAISPITDEDIKQIPPKINAMVYEW